MTRQSHITERRPPLEIGAEAMAPTTSATSKEPLTHSVARPGLQSRICKFVRSFLRSPHEKLVHSANVVVASPINGVKSRAVHPPWEQAFTAPMSPDRVRDLESRFLSIFTKLPPRERALLWQEMGAAYQEANNPADAAICWMNALWEEEKLSPDSTWGWFKAEAAQAGWDLSKLRIGKRLASPPTPVIARALSAYIVWAVSQERPPDEFRENLDQLHRHFDDQEETLPVRAAWLGRKALFQANRGDVRALALTRDRILQRLTANGLAVDVDAPAFIRFAESGDPDRFSRVRNWLIDKSDMIRNWIENLAPRPYVGETSQVRLNEFGLEAEITCTIAYANLLLAWGLSRLGEQSKAALLRNQAWADLDDNDPIHQFLKSSLDFRIRQACEGKAFASHLPAELMNSLETLSADDRYRVDRFRQISRILSSSERVDPFWASTFRHYNGFPKLRQRLNDLPALYGDALNERIEQLLASAFGANRTSFETLAAVLDVIPRLDQHIANKVFESVAMALDSPLEPYVSWQFRLLENALVAAAWCGQQTVVLNLVDRFVRLVKSPNRSPYYPRFEVLTREIFRCFCRFGLREKCAEILKHVDILLTNGENLASVKKKHPREWPSILRTLLPVAAAYYYSGDSNLGYAIIDHAGKEFHSGSMSERDKTALAREYVATLGQVPITVALDRFDDLFNRFKKIEIRGWNTHYTRQPLELIDTMIVAVVSEDFILGPSVRAWLDDEEFLVQRQIRKELEHLMKNSACDSPNSTE